MSEQFWYGFEKRANIVTDTLKKGKTKILDYVNKGVMKGQANLNMGGATGAPITSLGGAASHYGSKVKDFVGDAAWGSAKDIGSSAKEGFYEGLKEHAKKVGGKTGEHIMNRLGDIANKVPAHQVMDHLMELGKTVGFSRPPKGMLERAGGFVKKHPYATTGAGVASLGAAAYGVGRAGSNAPQQPRGNEGYQYYNPYS